MARETNICTMNIIKTSEKIIIWMHRNSITQLKLAEYLNTNRQSVAAKMKDNSFTEDEINQLKLKGFKE